jgi:hypothetical protein
MTTKSTIYGLGVGFGINTAIGAAWVLTDSGAFSILYLVASCLGLSSTLWKILGERKGFNSGQFPAD